MGKTTYQFEDFLNDVNNDYQGFVKDVHELLLQDNYKIKIEAKASGLMVSYSHPKTKRTILNFVFRKKGLLVRIYADHCNNYADVLNRLPERIVRQIEKVGICKRLIDSQSCNSKCAMGYDFHIGENHYQKCRYNCFLLEVDFESIPFLLELIERESKERKADA